MRDYLCQFWMTYSTQNFIELALCPGAINITTFDFLLANSFKSGANVFIKIHLSVFIPLDISSRLRSENNHVLGLFPSW